MDEELKKLIQENLEISKKNFESLKKIRRLAVWQMFFYWAKWIIVAILLIVGYFQLLPYLESLNSLFRDWGAIIEKLSQLLKK